MYGFFPVMKLSHIWIKSKHGRVSKTLANSILYRLCWNFCSCILEHFTQPCCHPPNNYFHCPPPHCAMCRWGSRRDGIHACEELQIHPTCTHKQDYVDNTWPAPPQYLVMSGQMNNSPHILCCFWVSLTNFYINSVRPRLCSSFPLCGYYRLTSLDASFAQCFAFWRISSKTLAPMFFVEK